MTKSSSPSSAPLPPGDHLGLRPDQLPGLPDQVEQCGGDHVQPVQGGRRGQMSARPLRAAGAEPRGRNEEVAPLPGAAVGPVSAASRRADRKGRRRLSLQVSIIRLV